MKKNINDDLESIEKDYNKSLIIRGFIVFLVTILIITGISLSKSGSVNKIKTDVGQYGSIFKIEEYNNSLYIEIPVNSVLDDIKDSKILGDYNDGSTKDIIDEIRSIDYLIPGEREVGSLESGIKVIVIVDGMNN